MASTSNTEILERFQSKVLRMIVDAPWYVPNTVSRMDLQRRNPSLELSIEGAPQCTGKRPGSEPHDEKTHARISAKQTLGVIVFEEWCLLGCYAVWLL
jgi:hypothetical protein